MKARKKPSKEMGPTVGHPIVVPSARVPGASTTYYHPDDAAELMKYWTLAEVVRQACTQFENDPVELIESLKRIVNITELARLARKKTAREGAHTRAKKYETIKAWVLSELKNRVWADKKSVLAEEYHQAIKKKFGVKVARSTIEEWLPKRRRQRDQNR